MLTSFNRFTCGCVLTKSLMFPFTIQSDIIANRVLDIVTPISGRTFGCWRVFHVMTSLQNLCTVYCQCTGRRKESTVGNSPRLPSVSHWSSVSLRPSRQRPGRGVSPSTNPQTHPCTTHRRLGHRRWGSSERLEETRGGHTSCTMI